MALLKVYVDEGIGFEFPDAYYRVTQCNLNMSANGAEFVVSVYKDAQARTDGKSPVKVVTYAAVGDDFEQFKPAALDTSNPVAKAYGYIKALPEFVDAVDV